VSCENANAEEKTASTEVLAVHRITLFIVFIATFLQVESLIDPSHSYGAARLALLSSSFTSFIVGIDV
jgi:hypothetical protein